MPQYKPAVPVHDHSPPEVCLNLWYFVVDGGWVYRLSGRAYALSGSDDAKLRLLQAFSGTDFYIAPVFAVPKWCTVLCPSGTIKGVTTVQFVVENQPNVFKEVIDSLEAGVPKQMHSVNGVPRAFTLKIPQNPLMVLTAVHEDESGNLIPMLAERGV